MPPWNRFANCTVGDISKCNGTNARNGTRELFDRVQAKALLNVLEDLILAEVISNKNWLVRRCYRRSADLN